MIEINIGNKLRSIRETKGMTIYKLSKETGISQNHIGGIELGKRQPTFDTLSRLLSPLGVTLSEFFNEDTETLYLSDDEKRLIENYRCLDARISKNERYIDISKTKTNLFMRTECSAIEQFYLCVCQDEKEKAGNEETPKVNNANIRQFKSLVLTLIDNCFDEPCVFYRDKRFLNYYLPPDHLVDRCDGAWTQYKEYNHLFSEFAGGRDVLAVTRLQCFQKMADDEDYRCIGQILYHILGHLISSLERTLETVSCYYISKYYRKIYNEELYEYVQKNLPNLSLDEKVDMISQKIQNEIVRM